MTASTPTFTVECLSFATVTELPHSWQAADYSGVNLRIDRNCQVGLAFLRSTISSDIQRSSIFVLSIEIPVGFDR